MARSPSLVQQALSGKFFMTNSSLEPISSPLILSEMSKLTAKLGMSLFNFPSQPRALVIEYCWLWLPLEDIFDEQPSFELVTLLESAVCTGDPERNKLEFDAGRSEFIYLKGFFDRLVLSIVAGSGKLLLSLFAMTTSSNPCLRCKS